ncbi:hypothetical protein BI364_03725 [Acidihalobacter yilgarnensis]|uniref:PilZ domain-containing protein n=1 Tax=Acidihalobacter yilgarnensis TaxID=2819280 RepID=A0A1D8ILA9_9GAMM|nr:PilZ domain-containing protein [Acidihalobacter yilgarnensis]AOU97223.1 hypothetical protein BI364_03725 [Acidihalobacter yilgarnensis]
MSDEKRDYDEKRDFIRMTIDCDVSYHLVDGSVIDQGRVRNLSGRGVLFQTGRFLDIGAVLDLSITSRSSSIPPLNARVEVVRVHEVKSGLVYEIGAVFHELL